MRSSGCKVFLLKSPRRAELRPRFPRRVLRSNRGNPRPVDPGTVSEMARCIRISGRRRPRPRFRRVSVPFGFRPPRRLAGSPAHLELGADPAPGGRPPPHGPVLAGPPARPELGADPAPSGRRGSPPSAGAAQPWFCPVASFATARPAPPELGADPAPLGRRGSPPSAGAAQPWFCPVASSATERPAPEARSGRAAFLKEGSCLAG
jgi:hypothetical protein